MRVLRIIGIVLLIVSFTCLQAQQTVKPSGYSIPVYDFNQFEPLLHPQSGDSTYVFNFWATYCAPCIKELPYFDQIGKEYASEKVKVILVSIDFKSQIESRVIPFLERRKVTSEVLLLSDPDANAWIDKVDPSWSGALPATLVVKGNQWEFQEKSFTYDELKQLVSKFLSK